MQQPDASQIQFKRAPLWTALVALFVNEDKYLDLAFSHWMAMNLKAPDLAASYRAGSFPGPGREQEARADSRQGMRELRTALLRAFAAVALASCLAVFVLWVAGNISPSLPTAWGKVLSAAGGFLAAWATLFELGGIWRSWEGEALHELVHPKLFALLFLPGTFLALMGQLW